MDSKKQPAVILEYLQKKTHMALFMHFMVMVQQKSAWLTNPEKRENSYYGANT